MSDRMIERKVMVGIPWRLREWVAGPVLDALEAQDYPKDLIRLHFIAHNSEEDNTAHVLSRWLHSKQGLYRETTMSILMDATRPDGRDSFTRDGECGDPRHAMARLKNLLAGYLQDDEWFFFLDSDLILAPDCLRRLITANKNFVGGLTNVTPRWDRVPVPPDRDGILRWNWMPIPSNRENSFQRDGTPNPERLSEIGFVSGLFLLSPEAWRGCKWRYYGVGEDEGAIRDAMRNGISIWLEPEATGYHVMRAEDVADGRLWWQERMTCLKP